MIICEIIVHLLVIVQDNKRRTVDVLKLKANRIILQTNLSGVINSVHGKSGRAQLKPDGTR